MSIELSKNELVMHFADKYENHDYMTLDYKFFSKMKINDLKIAYKRDCLVDEYKQDIQENGLITYSITYNSDCLVQLESDIREFMSANGMFTYMNNTISFKAHFGSGFLNGVPSQFIDEIVKEFKNKITGICEYETIEGLSLQY